MRRWGEVGDAHFCEAESPVKALLSEGGGSVVRNVDEFTMAFDLLGLWVGWAEGAGGGS